MDVRLITCFFIGVFSLLVVSHAFCDETVETEKNSFLEKLSGRVELDMSVHYGFNNLMVREDRNEKLSDKELNDGGDDIHYFWTPVLFSITYNASDTLQYYISTPFFDNSREGLSFGVSKVIDDYGVFDTYLFLDSDEVWKNPYSTTEKREPTFQGIIGLGVEYLDIKESGFNLFLKTRFSGVDEDLIGEVEDDLERKGWINTVGMDYQVYVSDNIIVAPGILYDGAYFTGESLSYNGGSLGISLAYTGDDYSVSLAASGGIQHYAKTHPIFGKTRKDGLTSAEIFCKKQDIFGWQNWYGGAAVSYSFLDSNIDFYDISDSYVRFVIGYEFE